ncbi:DEKNAAC104680 [Brettanomyces naardenensis]|uniref:DEKNAAC104680 n=1 Tax=Brettanomyces naardenensis TaxID=13370 RepID=A0A448YRI4_BRENA|nr:DEKNAAC104680 [Brettanomyces naardenensis]
MVYSFLGILERWPIRHYSTVLYRPGTTYLLGQVKLDPSLVSSEVGKNKCSKPSAGCNRAATVPGTVTVDPQNFMTKIGHEGSKFQEPNDDFRIANIIPELHSGWYDLLTQPLTSKQISRGLATFRDNVVSDLRRQKLYSSFKVCYGRELMRFGNNEMNLNLDDFHLDKDVSRSSYEPRKKMNKIGKLVEHVSDEFSDSRRNLSVINKRLKLKRIPPEFYLHQQFVINLGKKDLSRMLEIYFEFPQPRALHLTGYEFEKFMSLVLSYKMSKEDHLLDSEKLISLFESLHEDRIPLTDFELTKYVFFTIKYLSKYRGLDVESCFSGVMRLQSRFIFSQSVWNLILNEFPTKRSVIMKDMSNKIVLNRDLILTLCRSSESLVELLGILRVIQMKHIHLDQALLELMLTRLIDFGQYSLAKNVLDSLLDSCRSLPAKNSYKKDVTIYRTRVQRKLSRQYEALNGVLLSRARSASSFSSSKATSSRLVYYFFKPSSMLCCSFLGSLCNVETLTDNRKFEISNLLQLMIKYKIPLINLQAISILSGLLANPVDDSVAQRLDMDILDHLNELVFSSIDYNEYLHTCSKDFRFDKDYLREFIDGKDGESVVKELGTVFKLSFNVYRRWPTENETVEKESLRATVKGRMLRIYNELATVEGS